MEPQTERTKLPNAELEVSRLALGLSEIHRLPFRRDRQRLLDTALGAGITHFDAARAYGDGLAERELGRFLRGRRDAVTVATKFGLAANDAVGGAGVAGYPFRIARSRLARRGLVRWPRRDYSAQAMTTNLDVSLSLLGVDHIDV